MKNEKLIEGLNEINLWIYELTKVSDDDKTDSSNRHIKYFYKILDEITNKLRKEKIK